MIETAPGLFPATLARLSPRRADPSDIARNLAGWGREVEAVEPRSVRDEPARIGAEPTGRYADLL